MHAYIQHKHAYIHTYVYIFTYTYTYTCKHIPVACMHIYTETLSSHAM